MTNGYANDRAWQLLNLLADGEFHSGAILADRLGVSRTSVFNALEKVADSGVVLQRVRGRGYRLARSWHRLDQCEVLRQLGKDAALFNLEILPIAESSNTLLLQRARNDAVNGGAPSGSVLAIDLQTAGRGRMGRNWQSGVGTALTFSLLWRFDCGLSALSGLSLGAGVAVVRALKNLGVNDAQLKWPNDILTEQGKLAGVLIEAQGDMLGPSTVVIGIGLNYTMPDNLARKIDQPASALEEVCAAMPTRNQLLAAVLLELSQVMHQFAGSGFAALRGEWEQSHIYQNKRLQMQMADGQIVNGIARGVSDSGELCLETELGMRRFNSGEVTVKLSGESAVKVRGLRR